MKRLGLVLLALVIWGAGTYILMNSRTFQLFGEIIPRVETSKKVVALTLDDGPGKHAGEILDSLRQKQVKATFFLNGAMMEEFPGYAEQIVKEGHQVGNHTWSHPRMVFKSPRTIRSEIERNDAAIRRFGYRGEIHFRPPFGKKLVVLPWYLYRHGRKTITWDVEPETYPEIAKRADTIVSHVLQKTRPGSIILLHPMWNAQTRAAMPRIIDGLRARGYSFVTVDQLLASR
jgi:peptidoglycan/xylan/chitin deacetylase (PgdA/CDA1 family)